MEKNKNNVVIIFTKCSLNGKHKSFTTNIITTLVLMFLTINKF